MLVSKAAWTMLSCVRLAGKWIILPIKRPKVGLSSSFYLQPLSLDKDHEAIDLDVVDNQHNLVVSGSHYHCCWRRKSREFLNYPDGFRNPRDLGIPQPPPLPRAGSPSQNRTKNQLRIPGRTLVAEFRLCKTIQRQSPDTLPKRINQSNNPAVLMVVVSIPGNAHRW